MKNLEGEEHAYFFSSARLTRYEVAMLAFKDIKQRDLAFRSGCAHRGDRLILVASFLGFQGFYLFSSI